MYWLTRKKENLPSCRFCYSGWPLSENKRKWKGKQILRPRQGSSKKKKKKSIRTNYIRARIDKTQQNSKCALCDYCDETINYRISECWNLAQKEYKNRHDWVGKVIHWEVCKEIKFDHMNKWYMHNPQSVLENKTKTPLGFWDTNGSLNLGQMIRLYNN